MDVTTQLLLIPLLPLVAFAVQILFGRRLPRGGDWVSVGAVLGSFLLSVPFFVGVLEGYDPGYRLHVPFTWIDLAAFDITMGLLVDNLTALMLMIVTGVGGLIHVYSMGYMEDDPGYPRFFAYLSLFTFSMLGIVLTDNLFGLFVFWELVGLSSYFLIGFWYEKPSAANASKKAFLTTRVGDLGMFLGILILVWRLGPHVETPLAYSTVFEAAEGGLLDPGLLTLTGILLFLGAVGKSAQLPLHVWLPDAMEGPTPVSALIHAATMVAAGVYMVARLTPFFSPAALLFIGYVGAATAIVAASVALVKNDIKKVLAYSTVSQLGYMFLALGLGGYVAGVLHLTTHAIFKALLFLGSGSVIHAVHTQDMRDMGGLWKKMPVTFITFVTATLAITGVPFFSGFYSKEKILTAGLLFGWENTAHPIPYFHLLPYLLGVVAAGMTAFYMVRLVLMTFFGEPGDPERVSHAHESPRSMTIPMAVLGVLCLAFFFRAGAPTPAHDRPALHEPSGGEHAAAQVPSGHGDHAAAEASSGHGQPDAARVGWFEVLIENPDPTVHADAELHHRAEVITASVSLLVAGTGILLAALFYGGGLWILGLGGGLAVLSLAAVNYWLWVPLLVLTGMAYALVGRVGAAGLARRFPGTRKLLAAKYYFDEFYRDAAVVPTLRLARLTSRVDDRVVDGLVNGSALLVKIGAFVSGTFDYLFVDGAVEGVANTVRRWGQRARRLQSGEVQWYLNVIALGMALLFFLTVVIV